MQHSTQLIRPSAVCKMLAISKSSLTRLTKSKGFPKSIKIGSRAVAYDASELQAYIDKRKAERAS